MNSSSKPTPSSALTGGANAAAIQRRRQRFVRAHGGAAFTLVELLIVVALSALLLALLFGPLVQGFRLTNRARAQGAAQDATRFGIEQLSRELRQAAYVFDNSNTPIALPLEAPAGGLTTKPFGNVTRKNTYASDASGNNAIVVPQENYGRIDFISSEVRTDNTNAAATAQTNPTDPTTGRPLYGGQLRLTTAPGKIYTRYWIGLRRNITTTGATVSKAYYENVYEFPRTDNNLNPFVLWRADYDPTDPNLVAQVTDATSGQKVPKMTAVSGDPALDNNSFTDPDFFYNTNTASTVNAAGTTGNGKSYAENWRSIASPIVSAANLDLVSWRRDSKRNIIQSSPLQTGIGFTPSGVVGDTATPGYTTATQSENPTAVPSLYTTQYGQWTLPYTLTFYRGSTQFSPGAGGTDARGLYGSVAVKFSVNASGNLAVDVGSTAGSMAMAANAPYYWMRSASSGKIFVKLPTLSFIVDPTRGRVETGLPPLASNKPANGGAPLFYDINNGGAIVAMAPSAAGSAAAANGGNEGELVQTAFVESTLHRLAGQTDTLTGKTVPTNQGIFYADLAALDVQPVGTNGMLDRGNYYALSDTTHGTPYISPFVTFGGAVDVAATTLTNYQGAMIVAGSERVMGPPNQVFQVTTSGTGNAAAITDPNLSPTLATGATPTSDVAYTRIPSAAQSLARDNSLVTSPATGTQGVYVRRSPSTYILVQDLKDFNRPYVLFDDIGGRLTDPRSLDPAQQPAPTSLLTVANLAALGTNAAGMPAGFSTDTSAATHDRKVTVTYLWQNNYARSAEGRPVNASGQSELPSAGATTTARAAIQPEPDVIKADYASRTLINLNLAVRVYDTSSGQPQTSQVSDKIRVSNVSR